MADVTLFRMTRPSEFVFFNVCGLVCLFLYCFVLVVVLHFFFCVFVCVFCSVFRVYGDGVFCFFSLFVVFCYWFLLYSDVSGSCLFCVCLVVSAV